MKKKKWIFKKKWLTFYFGWAFEISYETCGYFDPRHRINLNIIFFHLEIILPIKSKHTDECDPPRLGIAYHNQTLWIYRGGKGNGNGGGKWWTVYAPWQPSWVRTSMLKKGTGVMDIAYPLMKSRELSKYKWIHETKKHRKGFYKDSWDYILFYFKYPYTYTLKSGKIQDRIATIKISEREWRWHWFKWLPLTKRVSRSIEIDFNDEVGERTGTWKGGCISCSYELRPNETPIECLRRMEKERKF